MESLRVFRKFIDEINADNGRLYKESILKKYKDNENIKFYLNFIFNPFITTGISDKKYEKAMDINMKAEWFEEPNIKDFLNYLQKHHTGDTEVLFTIKRYFLGMRQYGIDNLGELFKAVITKNLQLGVDSKTINKIIPGLIPEFNVQLANKYFDDPSKVVGKEIALTTKIDGGRIIAIKKDNKVEFFTRQGQLYEGLVDLEKEMLEHMPDNICLDGELTVLDKGTMDSGAQYKAAMKICRTKDAEKHGLKMLVFDYMPADDFKKQKCDLIYTERRDKLVKIFSGKHEFVYFNLLPILYKGTDTSEITRWLNYNIAHEEEGVMINICDAKYEFKRTWNLIKVKKMSDIDLRVKGYFEGENSLTGTLGGFVVSYKGYDLKVGSGFSKEFREEAWKNPNAYIGKIISIQYFEETTNADGGLSLRFPVFLDIRTDKTEPDFE